jgi:hypothetical protein
VAVGGATVAVAGGRTAVGGAVLAGWQPLNSSAASSKNNIVDLMRDIVISFDRSMDFL